MNNKLLTTVLANAGYSNPETLAQIINAVPNANVALEMLLGVHTPMTTETYYRYGNNLHKVTSIDELRDVLRYTDYEQKSKQVWYITKGDREIGIYQDSKPKGDYHDYGWVKTAGVTQRDDRTNSVSDSLNRWKKISEEEFYATLNNWEEPEMAL